jgi:chromosome segregation ATPase
VFDAGSALQSVTSAEKYVQQVKAVIGIAMEEAERSFQGIRNYVTDQGKLNMIAESQDLKNTENTERAMAVAKKALEKEFAQLKKDAKKVKDNADKYLKMVHDYEEFLEKVHGEAESKSAEFLGLLQSSKDKAETSRAEIDAAYMRVTQLEGQLGIFLNDLKQCGPKLKKLLGEKGSLAREQYALQKLTDGELARAQDLDSAKSQLSIGLDSLNTKNQQAQLQVNALTEQLEDIQQSLASDLATQSGLQTTKARKLKTLRSAERTLKEEQDAIAAEKHEKRD